LNELPFKPTNAQLRERLVEVTEMYATTLNYVGGFEDRLEDVSKICSSQAKELAAQAELIEAQRQEINHVVMRQAEMIVALLQLPRGAERYVSPDSLKILQKAGNLALAQKVD
jgi:hypothetical protein